MSERLEDIAAAIVANGKGLLAADESSGTIKKRFDVIGVESTADSRRDYREMMFRAKDAMTKYISGVILYDETIRQKAADGTPLVDIIKAAGAIPGIKVDAGAKPLAGFPGDTITEGLDGLRERLADYYKLGARFAKWRAVIDIDDRQGVPRQFDRRQHPCARPLCRALPGSRHRADRRAGSADGRRPRHRHLLRGHQGDADASSIDELYAAGVVLEGTILKPTWCCRARSRAQADSPEKVAEMTIKLFRETVPAAVPGIAFLSGGQEDEEATANLNAIDAIGPGIDGGEMRGRFFVGLAAGQEGDAGDGGRHAGLQH